MVLVARRAERLGEVAAGIKGAMVVVADIGQPGDVEAMAGEVLDEFGRIDILVNNAGVSDLVPAEKESVDQFDQVVRVNLVAAYHTCQVVGRHMLERGRGSIVNVASVMGFVSAGSFPQPGYAASKGGLVTLSKELAAQWSRRGVRVNALCPGWFHSEMTGDMLSSESGQAWIRRKTILGRPGREDELDGALVWLASDASSYVTGSAVVVDGGFLAM